MSNRIFVVVKGESHNTGTSTVAVIIEKALKEAGLANVEVDTIEPGQLQITPALQTEIVDIMNERGIGVVVVDDHRAFGKLDRASLLTEGAKFKPDPESKWPRPRPDLLPGKFPEGELN